MGLEVSVVIGLGLIAMGLWRLWRRLAIPRRAKLPTELSSAILVYSEQLFRSSGPMQITARVDRAYRNTAGVLVLVELKTRRVHRTYPSDVIELSAQRLALMAQTGEVVASHAYVLTVRTDGHPGKYHRVPLMTIGDVLALAVKREELLAGKREPRSACFPAMCRCSEQMRFVERRTSRRKIFLAPSCREHSVGTLPSALVVQGSQCR